LPTILRGTDSLHSFRKSGHHTHRPLQPNPIRTPIAEQFIKASFMEDLAIFHLLDTEVLFRQITLATA
jgi:hypothetical protein